MRWIRSLVGGLGASGSLVAAGVALLVALSAGLAFKGWPTNPVASEPGDAATQLALPAHRRATVSATAAPTPSGVLVSLSTSARRPGTDARGSGRRAQRRFASTRPHRRSRRPSSGTATPVTPGATGGSTTPSPASDGPSSSGSGPGGGSSHGAPAVPGAPSVPSTPSVPNPPAAPSAGQVVQDTTSAVNQTVTTVTNTASDTVRPVSPPVADTVDQVGQTVTDAVDQVGQTAGGILGGSGSGGR
jgi:hypothetical protein